MENKLPNNWTETLLNEVVSFQEGPGLRTIQMGSTGMPFLNIRTFNDDETLDKSKCKFVKMEEFTNKYEHFLLHEGDIVVSSSGTLGKAIVIKKEDLPVMLNTSVIRFRAISEQLMTQKYLKYFLKSDLFFKQIQEQKTGMAIDNYGPSHLQVMQIVIPPLSEQHRIVNKLDALMQKVESNKQRLDKIPKLLKRFRQCVLAAAVSGKLTEDWREKNGNDREWKEVELSSVIPKGGIFDGPFGSNLKTDDYTYAGVRVVRLENIEHLHFIQDKETYVTAEKYKTLIRHTVGEGDIIFSSFISEEIRACILPKIPTKAIAKADCFCIRPDEKKINKTFLLYSLVSIHSYEQLVLNIHGATRPRINTTQLKTLLIQLPNLEEQKEIVLKVEQLFAFSDKIEARYTKARTILDKLPQSVLAKAFRGELVPQNPDDEPASVLLERIKIEKDRIKADKVKKAKLN